MFGTRFGTTKSANPEKTPYATRADFCRIFKDDMDRLYLLAFMLAGDQATAERCFVGGLRMSKESSPVFREWAESWTRRSIILNAIRMIRPRRTDGSPFPASQPEAGSGMTVPAEIAYIATLPAFERFVFVMSVLERYPDRECSLLLATTRGDVVAARARALQQIGRSADFHRKLVTVSANQKDLGDNPAQRLEPFSHMAASA